MESTKTEDSHRHHSVKDLVTSYQHNDKKKSESAERTMSSISSPRGHIDPQTFIDAQSNGLAFRVSRYHDQSNKNSRISNRIYKRPGDYPIIHLDKPKLILNRKTSVAHPQKIARIGQPDPSIYKTSIRSEILRNGTLLPQTSVHHREDVSRRKEISRKRIHCEDTDSSSQVRSIAKDSTDSIPASVALSNSKRQRITTSPISPSNANQTNKKRHCSTRNNELFSSLSSSSHMFSSPSQKRQVISSPTNSNTLSQTKRIQLDAPIEPFNSEPPIKNIQKSTIATKPLQTSQPVEPAQPKLSLFNRKYQPFVPPPIVDGSDSDDECRIVFVKPKLSTGLSKEGISNLLKLKPVEKTKLSLMLSCLSGELDDDDTVDGKEGSKQPTFLPTINISTSTSAHESQNKTVKQVEDRIDEKVDSTSKPVPAIVTTSTSVVSSSTVSSLVFTKPISEPATTNPASIASTSVTSTSETVTFAAIPPKEVVTSKVTTDSEQRKGGFSFPVTPAVKPIVSSPITSTASSNITSTLKSNTDSSPKDTSTPVITFGFQKSNQATQETSKSPSKVAPIVEPTKGFTFGNMNSTATAAKVDPAFGSTSTANLFQAPSINVTKGTSVEQTKPVGFGDVSKPNSFPAFGQLPAVTSVTFGATVPSSTPSSLNTSIFGAPTTSIDSPKAQPPSFGSATTSAFSPITQQPSSTTQQSLNKDQSNLNNSIFSTNVHQQPVFGSSAPNEPKLFDPKTANGIITSSFTSIQPTKPSESIISFASATTTSAPFAFGASGTATTATPTFNATQTTQLFNIGTKTINSSTNVFGSSSTQPTPLFGSATNTKSNIFDQTSKIDNNSLTNRPVEPEKTTQNIFGTSTTKPSSTFSFSGTQPANTISIFGEQAAPPASSAFTFGGSTKNPTTDGSGDTKKTFTFGGNLGASAKPVEFGSKIGITTFGSSNVNDTAKTFGFTTNNPPDSSKLFNTNPSNEASKPFSFGGNNSTPAFGEASATPAFGGVNATSSFGATNATPAFGTTASFGNASTTPAFGNASTTPAFGSSNAPPAYGSSNASPAFGNTSTTSVFGSPSATPSFGNVSTTPAFGNANTTSAFGSSNPTPSFGNASTTPAFGSSSTTPSFGNTSTTSAFDSTSATPSFGNANTTPAFGSSNPTPSFGNASTTPAFGNSNPNPSFGNASSMSVFGGANTTPSFGGNSGTVTFGVNSGTFGSTSSAPNFGGTNFGGNITPAFVTSTGTADANKTFNFTGGDPTPSPIPNLFNIGPTNSAPKGRTIRTARRSNR